MLFAEGWLPGLWRGNPKLFLQIRVKQKHESVIVWSLCSYLQRSVGYLDATVQKYRLPTFCLVSLQTNISDVFLLSFCLCIATNRPALLKKTSVSWRQSCDKKNERRVGERQLWRFWFGELAPVFFHSSLCYPFSIRSVGYIPQGVMKTGWDGRSSFGTVHRYKITFWCLTKWDFPLGGSHFDFDWSSQRNLCLSRQIFKTASLMFYVNWGTEEVLTGSTKKPAVQVTEGITQAHKRNHLRESSLLTWNLRTKKLIQHAPVAFVQNKNTL